MLAFIALLPCSLECGCSRPARIIRTAQQRCNQGISTARFGVGSRRRLLGPTELKLMFRPERPQRQYIRSGRAPPWRGLGPREALNTVFAHHMDTGRIGDRSLTAFLAGDDTQANMTFSGLRSRSRRPPGHTRLEALFTGNCGGRRAILCITGFTLERW